MRYSRQRELLLAELRALDSHPTALELYELVRRRAPRLSLGTVYRNLELLAAGGVIRRLDFGKGEARFDGTTTDHYHVRCSRCGRIEDLDIKLDGSLERLAALAGTFEIVGHRLEFEGRCPDCHP